MHLILHMKNRYSKKRKDTYIILPANFKRFYKKIEAYFRLTLLVNLISLNFTGRIRSQIHTWVLLFFQIYAHSKSINSLNTFYFGSAPFLIECARQMMRTKSLSVTKMAAPMEFFWEWKKLPITCWISIFYLLVSQEIYIFSKSADFCFEISSVSIDNSHVIKMGVFKAIVLLRLKPVFLFDRVNCVAIFKPKALIMYIIVKYNVLGNATRVMWINTTGPSNRLIKAIAIHYL